MKMRLDEGQQWLAIPFFVLINKNEAKLIRFDQLVIDIEISHSANSDSFLVTIYNV
jgi:hypothetical protein